MAELLLCVVLTNSLGYNKGKMQHAIHEGSLQKTLKIMIVVANCFGLLPVDGATKDSVDDLRFNWRSLKTIYSLFLLLLGSFKLVANILYVIHKYSFPAMSKVLNNK